MLSFTKSRLSATKVGFAGKKSEYLKYCLIIVSLVLVSIQTQAQNGWTHKSNQPTHSAAASASVIDNKIYVIGGCDGAPNFNDLNVNEVYDPLSNTWDTTKLHMPTPRGWLYSGVVDGIIYAIGGGYPTATDKNEAYDPVTDTWTTKAPMIYPWCGVYGDVVNDKIYSVGGNYVHRNCFEFYPDSNHWTEKTPIPVGECVGPLSATVYNGLIYTFGGATNYPNGPLSTVNAYNPQTDTWDTTLAHMPTPRYALRTFLVNDKIYAIGGSQARYTSLAAVEVYDPVTDTWDTTLTDMPEPLAWFAGAVVNNKIYVIGGTPDWATGTGKVWEYDPAWNVPVELTSFTASANGEEVTLCWSTATEVNNQGFEIQRSIVGNDFFIVGFVNGHGTTTEQQNYSFADRNLDDGKYSYRLKQVDYDGSYEYSEVVEVEWRSFNSYLLEQNYPNPFNPTTTIGFGIQNKSNVRITILNAIGEEVAVVLNDEREPGFHKVEFNAANLPSGVYFYQLKAGGNVEIKKMILLK
jgi:N-acetylneuraminic acid mutarotase